MAQTLHSQPSQFNWACIAATGPEALNPMSLISAESNMLFDRALDNSHLDVGTTGFPMDPMSRTFSMPETQSNTDARNMFDTTDCYSEQSFGPAISVDSFDFDILDSQDDFGGANPVTTWSTPHSPYSCEFDGISFAPSGCTDAFDASLLEPTSDPFDLPRAAVPQRSSNRARSIQARMTQLQLSPLQIIQVTHTLSEDSPAKRKRSATNSHKQSFRRRAAAQPAPKAVPSSRQLAPSHSGRPSKRQAHESSDNSHCVYICDYCQRHKLSASSGQDGRVRIRCVCGGKHGDNTPRMHAKWTMAPAGTQHEY